MITKILNIYYLFKASEDIPVILVENKPRKEFQYFLFIFVTGSSVGEWLGHSLAVLLVRWY